MASGSSSFRLTGLIDLAVSMAAGRMMQLIAFFLMARVLLPIEMAQVVVLTLVFTGLNQLTNVGFDRYIIFSKAPDSDELSNDIDVVWTMQLIRAAVILLAGSLIILLLSLDEQLAVPWGQGLAVCGSASLISLTNPGLAVFERSGSFATPSRIRGLATIAGALASMLALLVSETSWSYALGQVIYSLVLVGMSFWFSRRKIKLSFDFSRWAVVFQYCKHLLLIAVVSYIALHAQNIYVAAIFSPTTLSAYFIWFRLVSTPNDLASQFSWSTHYATASEDARTGSSVARAHKKNFMYVFAVLIPIYNLIWFHGDILVELIIGDEFVHYWWAGRIMILSNLCMAFAVTMGPFLLVRLPHITSSLRTFEAGCTVLLIILLGNVLGDLGVVLAVFGTLFCSLIFRIYILFSRLILESRRAHFYDLMGILFFISAPFLVLQGISLLFADPLSSLVFILSSYLVAWPALFYTLISGRGRPSFAADV